MRVSATIYAVATLILCIGSQAGAQFTREYAPWPVIIDGDTLALPFWGGINSPKPALVDFDGDGLTDLMIGEGKGILSYFKNTGTSAVHQWTPQSERLAGLDIRSWHRFCDIDADGDPDLFADNGLSGAAFYRNESSGGTISFVLADNAFGGFVIGFNNMGDFADLDDDGDFDFFFGDVTGQLVQYRNDGDSANPSFVLGSDFYDSVFAFPDFAKATANPQHGFSAATFADCDGDLDLDLYYGDINNASLYQFTNLGTPAVSDLTKTTQTWLPLNTLGYNHTSFADLDDDLDLDLVVGAANGDKLNNLWLLRNAGSPVAPNFVIEDSNIVKNIDIGSEARPTFGDLDGDGDLDMLLGRNNGRLVHFANTGSATAPVFERTTDFYKSIDIGTSSTPTLTDWDADGDLDLLIGGGHGRIAYYQNQGSTVNFDPVLIESQLGGIQVDFLSSARAVDLNEDGLKDLIVGEFDANGFANVILYQNNGPAAAPVLSKVTATLLKREVRAFTLPQLLDYDCDGRRDLVTGLNGFGLTLYRNTSNDGQFPDSLTLPVQPDSLPGSKLGYQLLLEPADLDGDGDLDYVIGEEDGGLMFYRRDGVYCNCTRHGDPNGDGLHNVLDVVLTVNVAFKGGLDVNDRGCCPHWSRFDHNCDCVVNVLDVVTIVNTAFKGGPPPCDPCAEGKSCP